MKELIKNIARGCREFVLYVRYFHEFKSVGKRCVIQKPLRLFNMKNVTLGDRVYILPGLRMETINQYGDQTFTPELIIENDVEIHQNCHIVAADSVIIHEHVSVGAGTMINDCTHGYADLDLPFNEQPLTTKPIEIGKNTIIGNNVLILPGVKIGRNCYIGGNTVIAKSVPDYSIVSAPKPRAVVMPHED